MDFRQKILFGGVEFVECPYFASLIQAKQLFVFLIMALKLGSSFCAKQKIIQYVRLG